MCLENLKTSISISFCLHRVFSSQEALRSVMENGETSLNVDIFSWLSDPSKFSHPPYGPLKKYFTEDIDAILDIYHLSNAFVVDNGYDMNILKDFARNMNWEIESIIIYKFSYPLIDFATQIPGFERVPVPVMNVFLDYGKVQYAQLSSVVQQQSLYWQPQNSEYDRESQQQESNNIVHLQQPQNQVKNFELPKNDFVVQNIETTEQEVHLSNQFKENENQSQSHKENKSTTCSSMTGTVQGDGLTGKTIVKPTIDEIVTTEVIFNVLLVNPEEFEEKSKPVAERGNFFCTLNMEKIPIESARADDNGACASRGNSLKYYRISENVPVKVNRREDGTFFTNQRKGTKDGRPYFKKIEVSDTSNIYRLNRQYRYSKSNNFMNLICTIQNVQTSKMNKHYLYMNRWTDEKGKKNSASDFIIERHGNAKNSHAASYYRKDNCLFKEVQKRLESNQAPDEIYLDLSRPLEETSSVSMLVHNPKLVHNQKAKLRTAEKTPNELHEIEEIVSLIQTGTFIQSLSFNRDSYSAVNYSDIMLNDLHRFCVVGNSPWVVDTTFNLVENKLWFTNSSYSNESLIDNTGKHPVFPGPSQWQFRKHTESFRRFIGELVISDPRLLSIKKVGHDLDKATATGIHDILRNAKQLWCTQHLQNSDSEKLRKLGANSKTLRRIMSDIYGSQIETVKCEGLADAYDDEDLNVKLASLESVWEDLVPGFYQWFKKIRLPYFQDCLLTKEREELSIEGRFYSNSLELKHRLLKKKLDDLSSERDVRSVCENLKKWNEENFIDESMKALYGNGKYRLADGYRQFYVEPSTWVKWSAERRINHFKDFLNYIPQSYEKYRKPANAGAKGNKNEKRRCNMPEPDLVVEQSIEPEETTISKKSVTPLKICKTKSFWEVEKAAKEDQLLDVFDPMRVKSKIYQLIHRKDKKSYPISVRRCEHCKTAFTDADVIVVKITGQREFKKGGVMQKTNGNIYLHYLNTCLKEHDQKFEYKSIVVLEKTVFYLSKEQIAKLKSTGLTFESS